MVFEKLRSRIIGRPEAAPPSDEAIRAHVLGEMRQPGEPPFQPTPVATSRSRYEAEFEGEGPIAEAPALPELRTPEFDEFPKREITPAPPRELEHRFDERGKYELIDRLAIIEAQLSAIRAQTETLNERMKTFEMYLRSRMPRTGF